MITRIKVSLREVKYWFQRRIRGWSDDETWTIDFYFVKWLREHVKKYLEQAGKVVDLEFHKFEYKGQERTLYYLITRMIHLCSKLLKQYDNWEFDKQTMIEETKNELLDIFKLTFFYLWW